MMLRFIIIIAIFQLTLTAKTRRLLQIPAWIPQVPPNQAIPPPVPPIPSPPGAQFPPPVPPAQPAQPIQPAPSNPSGFPQWVPQVPPVPANPGGVQFAPVPVLGAYGQSCGPVGGSFVCTDTSQVLTDQATGTVECTNEYSCCLCKTVTCGYSPGIPCQGIVAAGAHALFGVEQVAIQGQYMGIPAVLDCHDFRSCANTKVIGNWVDTIMCNDQFSCQQADMELSASHGISCGREGCVDAKFTMKTNIAGDITCGGLSACKGMTVDINSGVEIITCGGVGSCVGATITVTNPTELFLLSCGGREGCRGLTLNVVIPEPVGGCPANVPARLMHWKGISCASNDACRDMVVNVQNDGCQPILMEELVCQAGGACTGMIIDFHKGKSKQDLFIQNCLCGPSCQTATGIDKCYNNVRIIECLNPGSCHGIQNLFNVANGFLLLCAADSSCMDYTLNIQISGYSQNIIRTFTGVDCSAPKACKGLKVAMSNTQYDHLGQPVKITVGAVICSASTACDDAVFITGENVEITQVICTTADACNNCKVKKYPTDIGKDCYTPIELPAAIATTAAPANPRNPFTTAAATRAATTAAATTAVPNPFTTAAPSIPTIPLTPVTTLNRNIQPVTTAANAPNPEPPVVDIPGIPNIPIVDIPPATTSQNGPTTTLSLLEFLARELNNNNQPTSPGHTEPIGTPAATTVPIPDIPINKIPPAGKGSNGIIPPFWDPAVSAATTTAVDVLQTGGAPAPPAVDPLPVDPIPAEPIIPQIKIGASIPEMTSSTAPATTGPPLV